MVAEKCSWSSDEVEKQKGENMEKRSKKRKN
jgi:hypothetical protein